MTRARIDSLLYEVRRFRGTDRTWCVEELGRRYCLDPMMVRALLESEGIATDADPEAEPDPNQTTQVMSTDELLR
ncbi:MAG TPA: hypothetical protein VFG69_11185 [Nannocystaceae bacterium]|nr:hypothetical protein [Nannocystaceae bacterium]